jgi:hypothetical protein
MEVQMTDNFLTSNEKLQYIIALRIVFTKKCQNRIPRP